MRVSSLVRYESNFVPPTTAFPSDGSTAALWHFDDVPGTTTFVDSSANGNTMFGHNGASTVLPEPTTLTWDADPANDGDWVLNPAKWDPDGPPTADQNAVVEQVGGGTTGRLTVSTYEGDGGKAVAKALHINHGTVDVTGTGQLEITNDVVVGDFGTLQVDGGVLAADGINVTGGLLNITGAGSVGTAGLTVAAGVVNASQPVTITERLTIAGEPVINVTNGLFSVKGDDLLNDPVRELTLQGGEVAIDPGGLTIDMPGTDIIVVDDTTVDLGAATSATFDEVLFGAGSILTIESDNPVSLFFGGISGEGRLDASSFDESDVTVTGLLSPGETDRVLTIARDASAEAVADYIAMLGALGYPAEAENVAMACLDGDLYLVISAVPEPATLSLLFIGGFLAVACRRRRRLSR